jgi:phage baseplate assembly protein W
MSRETGGARNGLAHLQQSITDILTTPIGSRVMRRDYGSHIFELVDAPMNRATLVAIYAATAEAIARWEPRFAVSRVQATDAAPGRVTLSLTGTYRPNGKAITLDGVAIT